MDYGMGIWVQGGVEGDGQTGFAVTRTHNQSTNVLGIQKYQAES